MLFNSYNQQYKTNNQYQTRVTNILGYDISIDGGSTWDYSVLANLNIENDLYGINSTDKATAMWVASPSSRHDAFLMYVNCYGTLGMDSFGHRSIGFRPVICLKSNVQLKKVENGYEIIEN